MLLLFSGCVGVSLGPNVSDVLGWCGTADLKLLETGPVPGNAKSLFLVFTKTEFLVGITFVCVNAVVLEQKKKR